MVQARTREVRERQARMVLITIRKSKRRWG